jgi:Transposase DDE domain group 1
VHSDKELARPNFKGGYGYHPLLAFPGNTSEALAGILRPGNAGSSTAADHIQVTHLALAQIPGHERHGQPILSRADGAGAPGAWLGHLHQLRTEQCPDLDYSVGFTMNDAVQQAILALPEHAWTPAVQIDGGLREGADVAELTGMLPDLAARGWPPGMRVIARRETAPPRSPADLLRYPRLPLPGLRHQHQDRTAGRPRSTTPCPRPRRGPHPRRQGLATRFTTS